MARGRPRLDDAARQESRKKNFASINEWKRQYVDRLAFDARKELKLPEHIQMAVEAGKAKSKQDYMLMSIKNQLEQDGFPIENVELEDFKPMEE